MSVVRRAFNVIKGVSRGRSQKAAAAKVKQDSAVALANQTTDVIVARPIQGAWNEAAGHAAGAAAGPSFWDIARDDWKAFGAGWRAFWRPPKGSSRWRGFRDFVGSDDIRAKYSYLPEDQQDMLVLASRFRRGAMLGVGALWGLSQVRDLADRAFNPNRHFMMDSNNRRVDLPIVPFI